MLCSVVSGDLTLLEHEAACWLSQNDLYSVKWLPADDVVLKRIEGMLSGSRYQPTNIKDESKLMKRQELCDGL